MFNGNQGVYYRGVQTVSPAGSGNASNGLSVDPVSGDYVLGNNAGQAGAPAQLISNREIITNQNFLTLKDSTSITTRMIIGNVAAFNVTLTSAIAQINYGFNQGILPLIFLRQSDGAINIGQDGAAFNGAQLQISGTTSGRAPIRSQASGTMNLDKTINSAFIVTNTNGTGLLTVNLPDLTLSVYTGFHIWIIVDNANGIRFTSSTASINVSGQVAAAGAFVSSKLVGSAMHLFGISGGARWYATSVTGSWNL